MRFLHGGLVLCSEALRCMLQCYFFEVWSGGWLGGYEVRFKALNRVVLGEVSLRLLSCWSCKLGFHFPLAVESSSVSASRVWSARAG